MKPTIIHGKRLRPDAHDGVPLTKRQRKTEAPSVVSPQKNLLDARHREAMRIIQHSFHQGSTFLDLSMLDPATVQSLPFSMVRNFVGEVRSLTLPVGMQCLPLICSAMPELQALHAPNFNGMSLDLSNFHKLRNLSGSASSALKEIHLQITVDINFHAEQKLSKIRVWRYQNGQAIQQHPLPSHTYYKTLPGRAAPDFSPLNAKACFADGSGSIFCRHLSDYVLEKLLSPDFDPFSAEGYLGLTDAATLPQKILPASQARYWAILTSSKHYHFVDNASFAIWASAQFAELETAETLSSPTSAPMVIKKGFLALSSNHALVCLLAIKPGPLRQYAIVLYDPNPGLTHQRRIATSIGELRLRNWRFTDLLEARNVSLYFAPGHQPLLCLIEPELRAANDLPTTHYATEAASLCNQDLLAGAIINNLPTEVMQIGFNLVTHYRAGNLSAQVVFNILKGRKHPTLLWCSAFLAANSLGIPFMVTAMMAVLKDFAKAVKEKAVANGSAADSLPADFCLQLLQSAAGWDDVLSGRYEKNGLALQELSSKTMELVNDSLITGGQAAALLSTLNARGVTCSEYAITLNKADDLRIFGSCVTTLCKNGAIDFERGLMLLDQSSNRAPASEGAMETLALMACRNGWNGTLDVYADLLIELAGTVTGEVDQAKLALSDRIIAQVMSAVSIDSVREMMQAPDSGERFRMTLQAFLLRLSGAGVLEPANPLSQLCESEAPPPPSAPQTVWEIDDFLLDDGLFPF
jgi:hypothetical protein